MMPFLALLPVRHASLILAFAGLVSAAPGQAAASSQGERGVQRAPEGPVTQWAVLVGVKNHQETRLNLSYTLADAKRLQQVLQDRAGIPAGNLLVMTDESADDRKPTLANLRREIPRFLSKAKANDHLLVFFAGHGFLHQGKTYLVPSDCRSEELDRTALPAEELKAALESAQGKIKFLVLDCCHAGGARDLAPKEEIAGEDLARSLNLQAKEGVVILASCKDKESSWEWNERRHGVFSYWLCRALEGAADANNDGVLDVDEVFGYTYRQVSTTVTEIFGRSQTPVRVIGSNVIGVSPLLKLGPESPESLCRRLAEEFDLELRRRKINKVGVLEFGVTLGQVEKLAQSNLPAHCARRIQANLTEMGAGAYTVLREESLKAATRGMKFDDLRDPRERGNLDRHTGGVQALVTGMLRRRERTVNVQCELIHVANGSSLATPSGVLPLSEDLLGDQGFSFDNRQRPPGAPHDEAVVKDVQARIHKGNPLLNKDFPFRIEVFSIHPTPGEKITSETARKPKSLTVIAGGTDDPLVRRELALGVRQGEIIELRVTNNWIDTVAMSLLVDGMNTLGQKPELLGKGRAWVLEPSKSYRIAGWYVPEAQQLKRFQFVDLASSVAARERFGDSIGLITAAFYAGHGRGLAVGEGPQERRTLKADNDFAPGRLLGVVNLRYVEERSLR